MWKILILIITVLNMAVAQERFSSTERSEFLNEVKKEIAEGKFENAGSFSLEIIKPDFYEQLEDLYLAKKITRSEYDRIKKHFEEISKSGLSGAQAETTFITFIESELKEINKKSIPVQKENEICNELTCVAGLTCAPEVKQVSIGDRKKAGEVCTTDSECSSYDCVNDGQGKGKKICEDVYKCFRPLNLGESCSVNPICGAGICLDYDSMTAGIGECAPQGKSCKTSADCCSNSCNSGRCESNRVCKDCAGVGSKVQKLQKCCEGLYKNQKGFCVPDVPPSVIIEVKNSIKPSIFENFLNVFFSSAHAQSDSSGDISREGLAKEVKRDSMYSQKSYDTSGNKESFDSSRISKKFNFKKESNFKTCQIDLKSDFLKGLTKTKAIDLEMSLLAFDYMMSGEQIDDYWRLNKNDKKSSLNSRLKKASTKNVEHRKKMLSAIEESNQQLLCLCLDVKGFKNIEKDEDKEFFSKSCPDEYEKYATAELDSKGNYKDENLNGDASGIKGKTLIVEWTSKLEELHMGLAVEVFNSSDDLHRISEWAQTVNWSESRHVYDELFKFHVKGSASFVGMGALAGAVLAAGVVAILGGFSLQSFVSYWAIAGIIATSTTAGMGMWMVGSLRGAWSSLRPEISDYITAPRSVSCGKKDTCTEYTRTLVQPYNSVCDSHISANGCVVKFAAFQYSPEEEIRYLVDPFQPLGSGITPGNGLYTGDLAKDLNNGYLRAKDKMVSLNPKTYIGGKSGGKYVSSSYLSEVFIDAEVTGNYIAPAMANYKNVLLTKDHFMQIMKNAKTFAIDQKMIEADDEDNLQVFAETALYYHFLWPKTTKSMEISYPAVGLQTYLSVMANDISANLAGYYSKEALGLNDLGIKYDEDRLKTIEVYKGSPAYAGSGNSSYINGIGEKAKEGIARKNAISQSLQGNNDSAAGTIIGQNSTLTALDKDFIKTVSGLRNLRNSQLEASRHYTQEMGGNLARMQKMQAVAKEFKKGFSSGRSKISGNALSALAKESTTGMEAAKAANVKYKNSSGTGSGSSSASRGTFFDSVTSDTNQANAQTEDTSGLRNGNYSASIGGLSGGSYGGSNYGRGSVGSGSMGRGESDTSSSSGGAMSQSSLNDMKTLKDAIDARNKRGNSHYKSDAAATIFEQITNAYIRNYDKVLTIRKSKDTIEDSE